MSWKRESGGRRFFRAELQGKPKRKEGTGTDWGCA